MGLEKLAGPIEKAAAPVAKSVFARLVKAVAKPAIPEIAERGTAAAPALVEGALGQPAPIPQHAPDVPYLGSPETREYVRATEVEPPITLEDIVNRGKEFVGSFFRHDPNLPKDAQGILGNGKWRAEHAQRMSDKKWEEIYRTLQRDPVVQKRQMDDLLIHLDEIAQAGRGGKTSIQGQSIEKWMTDAGTLEKAVGADPEVAQVLESRRALWDEVFQDKVNAGELGPEHYLEDYTHIRKVLAVDKANSAADGQKLDIDVLAETKHRTGTPGYRETNLLLLERKVLARHLRNKIDKETLMQFMDDKTINLTDKFKPYDRLPSHLLSYQAGPGMAGRVARSADEEVMEGMQRAITAKGGIASNVHMPGGIVFPKPLVKALMNYHGSRKPLELENDMIKIGRKIVNGIVTYNPAVVAVNWWGDHAMALAGMKGEKAQPLGILRLMPEANIKALKVAFTKERPTMKIGGQEVDLRDMLDEHGIENSTLYHDASGTKISDELMRLMPEADRSRPNAFFDFFRKMRMAGELAPRIAAGVEAAERTLDVKEFGRVGRQITLTYGPEGPAAAKMPLFRAAAPIMQFIGLATGRTLDMLQTPGSRARTAGMILALPFLVWKWNTRNPEFQKVEDALPPHLRDQSHVIWPSFSDPTVPMLDVANQPVVTPVKIMFTEEVMRAAGLGNMFSRLDRVSRGRDSMKNFVKETVYKGAVKTPIETVTMMPNLVSDLAETTTPGGKKLTAMDRVKRVLPATRAVQDGIERGETYGAVEGVKTTAMGLTGMRPMPTMHRGKHQSDADLVIARAERTTAQKLLRKAIINGTDADKRRARKQWDEAKEKLSRIIESRKNEREAADGSE